MIDIIIKNQTKEYIGGTYFGQPYKINLNTQKDELSMLLDEESKEVINSLNEQAKENNMLLIKEGTIVRVCVEEGHDIFEYNLKIKSIEEECNDDNGNYCCVAFGVGITEEDEECAEELTHMVDSMNFCRII